MCTIQKWFYSTKWCTVCNSMIKLPDKVKHTFLTNSSISLALYSCLWLDGTQLLCMLQFRATTESRTNRILNHCCLLECHLELYYAWLTCSTKTKTKTEKEWERSSAGLSVHKSVCRCGAYFVGERYSKHLPPKDCARKMNRWVTKNLN